MTLRLVIAVLCASFTVAPAFAQDDLLEKIKDVREKCIEKGFFK